MFDRKYLIDIFWTNKMEIKENSTYTAEDYLYKECRSEKVDWTEMKNWTFEKFNGWVGLVYLGFQEAKMTIWTKVLLVHSPCSIQKKDANE
jgi:hypothetical protein